MVNPAAGGYAAFANSNIVSYSTAFVATEGAIGLQNSPVYAYQAAACAFD